MALAATAAEAKLELVGGSDARTVKLQGCPARVGENATPPRSCPKASPRPYLGGVLTIAVRQAPEKDKTLAPKSLTLTYTPDDGSGPIELSSGSGAGKSAPVFLVAPARKELSVAAKSPLTLTIGFAPRADESAAAVDGSLALTLGDEADGGGETIVVPVDGESRVYAGVSVAPSTLPMEAGNDAKVVLEGPELVEYLTAYRGEPLSATLHANGDDTASVELTLPGPYRVDRSATRGHVEATVRPTGDGPSPGEYKGSLSFPGLPADADAVAIELSSRWHWWKLVVAVLAGLLTLGVGTRIVTTTARRHLLQKVLGETVAVYLHVVCSGAKTRSWSLEDLLAENPCTGAAPPPEARLQGLPGLEHSIETARSGTDLDEDAARVLDMVARMQRWLRVEPLARLLHRLEQERRSGVELPKVKGGGKLQWEHSNTLRDTRILLAMAASEPADATKADDIVARMLFQADWHNRVWALWKDAGDSSAVAAAVRKLETALEATSKAATRTVAEQNALEATLRGAWSELKPNADPPDLPQIDGEPLSKPDTELGLTKVDWEASWNLFTGWATLDGPSYGQLTRRTLTSNRATYTPRLRDAVKGLRPRSPDVYWTVAVLAVASAAYAATAYDETWGGCTDLATAFFAGVLGKATVDWAALPIFQSLRLRKAAKSS